MPSYRTSLSLRLKDERFPQFSAMRISCLAGPLGALAGNPFGIDRQELARDLGFFGGVCPNSMDAVSDRDFVLETLFATTTHLVHLSRWAEDLIIYSSGQFKFVQCSDAYATGEVPAPMCLSCSHSALCEFV